MKGLMLFQLQKLLIINRVFSCICGALGVNPSVNQLRIHSGFNNEINTFSNKV